MPAQVLVFDLDGTLVDSEGLSARVMLEMLPALDDSVEGWIQRYRGGRLRHVLDDIERRLGCALPTDFESLFRSRVAQLFASELQPMPGALEMLDAIAASEHRRCIASSGPPAKIRHSLSVTGLARYFDQHVYSAYEIGSWKPDPGLFLHAAAAMSVAPADCLVIEDSIVGIRAAQAAGMPVLHYCPDGAVAAIDGVPRFEHLPELPRLLVGR